MQLLKIGKKLCLFVVPIALSLGISSLPLLAADTLDMALPSNATINLKDGKQISGVRLVEIDSQTQSVKFAKGGNADSRALNLVKSITFKGNYEIKSGDMVVMRGSRPEGCSNQNPMTVPLNHFKVESGSQAEMNLSSLPTARRREISQTSRVRGFVVNELQFNGKGAINVVAKACAVR